MKFAVTERGTFRRCRRQAVLTAKNGLHLTPIFSPLNLSLGTIMHRGHHLWITTPDVPFPTHILNASLETQEKVRANYLRQVGAEPSSAEMLSTHEAVDMAMQMAENYQVYYGSPLPPDYKFIAAEQKISVEIPETKHECPDCHGIGMVANAENTYDTKCATCNGTGDEVHSLEGTLDGIVQHIPTGRFDVLERKTYKNRPKHLDLASNDQFLSYIFLVDSLQISPDMPKIAYDGMWRRGVIPRGKQLSDLFARYVLSRTPAELAEFKRFIVHELNDMAAVYRDHHKAYINRKWDGCWDCKVAEICLAMSRGEDASGLIAAKYTQRTDDMAVELLDDATEDAA